MVPSPAAATQLHRLWRWASSAACAAVFLAWSLSASAQDSKSTAPPKTSQDNPATKAVDPEAELQKALADAGNDSAAMVRNLKNYLQKFPGAPRKAGVYRALVEACQQIRDNRSEERRVGKE